LAVLLRHQALPGGSRPSTDCWSTWLFSHINSFIYSEAFRADSCGLIPETGDTEDEDTCPCPSVAYGLVGQSKKKKWSWEIFPDPGPMHPQPPLRGSADSSWCEPSFPIMAILVSDSCSQIIAPGGPSILPR
jgi:hypothetical protein